MLLWGATSWHTEDPVCIADIILLDFSSSQIEVDWAPEFCHPVSFPALTFLICEMAVLAWFSAFTRINFMIIP